MAVLKKEELIAKVKEIIGDSTDDKVLGFMEDFTDTVNSFDSENWKEKYEENDKNWRQRYKDRFFGKKTEEDDSDLEEEEEPEQQKLTYENLFKEGEK